MVIVRVVNIQGTSCKLKLRAGDSIYDVNLVRSVPRNRSLTCAPPARVTSSHWRVFYATSKKKNFALARVHMQTHTHARTLA